MIHLASSRGRKAGKGEGGGGVWGRKRFGRMSKFKTANQSLHKQQ